MTDYNPITTPNTVLTDALNATYITYNGNEMMIQNDMGNTLIQDTTTGNLMGLSTGFLPVGMKEHGGILYIASYNPKTNQSELGTIPSPLFNYTYDTKPKETEYDAPQGSILNFKFLPATEIELLDLQPTNKVLITNYCLYVGELFMVELNFDQVKTIQRYVLFLGKPYPEEVRFPILSEYKTNVAGLATKQYGLYDLKLFAGIQKSNLGLFPMELVNNSVLEYYTIDDPDNRKYGTNWFLTSTDKIDVERCYSTVVGNATATKNTYRTYPNIQYGNLFVLAVVNENEECLFVQNNSTQMNSPYYFKIEILVPIKK